MATRTFYLYGAAYSIDSTVSLDVSFNNTQVHNSTVTTISEEVPLDLSSVIMSQLLSFTADTDVTGEIPVSITVTGGDLVLGVMQANYVLPLSVSDFKAKILEDNPSETFLNSDGIDITTTTAWKESSICQLFDQETPGADWKRNVLLDGVDITEPLSGSNSNDTRAWSYLVEQDETITFNQYLDPTWNLG